nr:reverse transcriptase domain-containing protein [Tanacetum cinerariifolium]
MKSAGKWNVPTFTKTSSTTPTGREIERSAISRVIHVGDSSGRESLFHTDNGIRFMLAPRSAKAKHSSILGKSHGIRNLSGSPNFFEMENRIPFDHSNINSQTSSRFSIHASSGHDPDVQPAVVQIENQITNSEPVVAPVVEPVVAPLSLPELSPTCMTLEIADRSISRPVGVVEDVFIKVGTFHFLADFIVVDFDADPRVLLILGRSFLKTGRALIDVYEGELTLRVGKESVTFNLDRTSRYSANYDAMSVNRIDLIDIACEEYSQKVLGFSVSGNPTPSTEPIVSMPSPTLTPFGDNDFLLKKADAFLAIDDEPISPKIDESYYDSEGDILLLKNFLMMIHHHHLSLYKNSKLLNLPMKNILLMNHPWSNLRTYHL